MPSCRAGETYGKAENNGQSDRNSRRSNQLPLEVQSPTGWPGTEIEERVEQIVAKNSVMVNKGNVLLYRPVLPRSRQTQPSRITNDDYTLQTVRRVAQPFAFFAKAGVVQPSPQGCGTQSYPSFMRWGLKRYQQTRQLHFITFSCYGRAAPPGRILPPVYLSPPIVDLALASCLT